MRWWMFAAIGFVACKGKPKAPDGPITVTARWNCSGDGDLHLESRETEDAELVVKGKTLEKKVYPGLTAHRVPAELVDPKDLKLPVELAWGEDRRKLDVAVLSSGWPAILRPPSLQREAVGTLAIGPVTVDLYPPTVENGHWIFTAPVRDVASASSEAADVTATSERLTIDIDGSSHVRKLASVDAKVALEVPFTVIATCGKRRVAGKLTASLPSAPILPALLVGADKQGMDWAAPYVKGPDAPALIALTNGGAVDLRHMRGKALREAMLVAHMDRKEEYGESCGPYGPSAVYAAAYRPVVHAVVRELRTGKELAKRTFAGTFPKCPTTVTRRNGQTETIGGDGPDDKAIHAWIASVR